MSQLNECLLCEAMLVNEPSWQALISRPVQVMVCASCSSLFERLDREEKTDELASIYAIYDYNDAMKNYLHQFKFLQDIALAPIFGKALYELLKGKKNIVPIPVHSERRIERTFSQVEALLDGANLPYLDVLEKRDAVTMGEKTREERLATKPLFQLKPMIEIQPETYILFDDIYTTGTTLNYAAKVLKAAGAKRIEAVTLIRA